MIKIGERHKKKSSCQRLARGLNNAASGSELSETGAYTRNSGEWSCNRICWSRTADSLAEDTGLLLCVGLNALDEAQVGLVRQIGEVNANVRSLQKAKVAEAIADVRVHQDIARNGLIVHERGVLAGHILQVVTTKQMAIVIIKVEANLELRCFRSEFALGVEIIDARAATSLKVAAQAGINILEGHIWAEVTEDWPRTNFSIYAVCCLTACIDVG